MSRGGECRRLLFADNMALPVIYDLSISTEEVVVSIFDLALAFLAGVSPFLTTLKQDPTLEAVIAERAEKLLITIPAE